MAFIDQLLPPCLSVEFKRSLQIKRIGLNLSEDKKRSGQVCCDRGGKCNRKPDLTAFSSSPAHT
jgi:hypothetical protein